MNTIKAIKSWWKPEVKEASTKATVRFKNGVVIDMYYPEHAGLVMRKSIAGFVNSNRDLEKEAKIRSGFELRARDQAIGMEARGFGGQYGLAAQQSHIANRLLSDREMGRLI